MQHSYRLVVFAYSSRARVFERYNVSIIPTLVLIDQDGYIRYRHIGLTEASVISQEIEARALMCAHRGFQIARVSHIYWKEIISFDFHVKDYRDFEIQL